MPVAHLVEWTYRALSRYGMPVPQLTPSRIRLLSCNRTFNGSKAKDQLGYEPIVSLEVFHSTFFFLPFSCIFLPNNIASVSSYMTLCIVSIAEIVGWSKKDNRVILSFESTAAKANL